MDENLNVRLYQLGQFLKSINLPLSTEIIIYTQQIRPIMTYSDHLLGAAKTSNFKVVQFFQSISLRLVTNASWYVCNRYTLHHDLTTQTIPILVFHVYKEFHSNTHNHTNLLIFKFPSITPPLHIKFNWPRDLLKR